MTMYINIEQIQKDVTRFFDEYTVQLNELKVEYEELHNLIQESKKDGFVQGFLGKSFTISSEELYKELLKGFNKYILAGKAEYLESLGFKNASKLTKEELKKQSSGVVHDLVLQFNSFFANEVHNFSEVHALVSRVSSSDEGYGLNVSFELDGAALGAIDVYENIKSDVNKNVDFEEEVVKKYNLLLTVPNTSLSEGDVAHVTETFESLPEYNEALTLAQVRLREGVSFLKGAKKLKRLLDLFEQDFIKGYNEYVDFGLMPR